MAASLQDASWAANRLAPDGRVRLSDTALALLASRLEPRHLDRGKRLYGRGDVPPGAWILQSATVELSAYSGRRRSIVQLLHGGDVVGDVHVLLEEPSLMTVRVASEGGSLFVDGVTLRSVLAGQPELGYLWLHSCARRLHQARLRVLTLLSGTLSQSLARLLLDEERDGRVPLSQSRIAQMLGVQRTSVNRALRALRETGAVEVEYSAVLIRDPGTLSDLAYAVNKQMGPTGLPLE